MHLLTTSSTSLDEIVEAVDLGQTPGDIVILSFADSDLAALASAWEMDRAELPSLRLAHLRDHVVAYGKSAKRDEHLSLPYQDCRWRRLPLGQAKNTRTATGIAAWPSSGRHYYRLGEHIESLCSAAQRVESLRELLLYFTI